MAPSDPETRFKLFYVIEGQPAAHARSVLVSLKDEVDVLHEAIFKTGIRPTDYVGLYMLDLDTTSVDVMAPCMIPINTRPLVPTSFVAELYPGQSELPKKRIHIAVRIVPSRSAGIKRSVDVSGDVSDDGKRRRVEQEHEKEVKHGVDAIVPSSAAHSSNLQDQQNKHPIYNGRPDSLRAPSIAIYHHIFGKFKAKLEDLTWSPTAEGYRLAHQFIAISSEIYSTEAVRVSALKSILEDLLDHHLLRLLHDDRSTSAGLSAVLHIAHATIKMVVFEIKNEFGTGRSDPAIQGGMVARKSWVQTANSWVHQSSSCPTFIVAIAGPHMMISGAVLVDKTIVQPLTDYVCLGGDPFEERRVRYVARIFSALASGLKMLRDFYTSLEPSDAPVVDRLFPYVTEFNKTRLKYIECLRSADPKHAVFLASRTTDDHKLVVKFVENYAEHAHRLLAEHNLAPELHCCMPIEGGLKMVVMDFIQGEGMHEHTSESLRDVVVQDVPKAVKILHSHDYVFGDLRQPNVMVRLFGDGIEKRIEGAMLVDFDWCGKDGVDCYPAVLNDTGQIAWHGGVVRGGIMRKEHDLHMLEQLK